MASETADIATFLGTLHPYDSLDPDRLADLAARTDRVDAAPETPLYTAGDRLDGLYIVVSGQIDVRDRNGQIVSLLGPGNSFGERGLLRDGIAATSARATEVSRLYRIDAETFRELVASAPAVARFFDRSRPAESRSDDISGMPIADLMSPDPLTCAPGTTVAEAARLLRDRNVSCLLVVEGQALRGAAFSRIPT